MFFKRETTKPDSFAKKLSHGLLLCTALLPHAHSQESGAPALEPLRAAFPLSPYTHVDEQGVPYGFAPNLVSIIGQRLGRDIDIQIMPYLRTLHAIRAGQVDITFGLEVFGSSVYLPEGIVAATEPQLTLPVSFYALPERKIRITNMEQAGDYRMGTIRLETKDQRLERSGHNSSYYYKDAYSLTKALQAHHIDLATLEPGSATKITQELGLQLERIYDYNHMKTFPVFSNASTRIQDPLDFCQRFVEARIEAFQDGTVEKLLKDIRMTYLLPYYNRIEITSEMCRITQAPLTPPEASAARPP